MLALSPEEQIVCLGSLQLQTSLCNEKGASEDEGYCGEGACMQNAPAISGPDARKVSR